MKIKSFVFIFNVVALLFFSKEYAQTTQSKYNYQEAFAPFFYSKNGNDTRSASGKPGSGYWQNRADYQLSVNLDEAKNLMTGSCQVSYTNNSPDKLEYLWMFLDQNLFLKDSRANAIIPITGSRNGAQGQIFDGGFKIKAVKLLFSSKTGTIEKDLKFIISDTRMQVFLPEVLAAKGGNVKFKVDYTFEIPNKGSDRMGVLGTVNGKIFAIAQWYPRMCVYDDVRGWNTQPYIGASEFYLDYGDFDVKITAPSNHFVVCSGDLLNPKEVYNAAEQKQWEIAKKSDKAVIIRSEEDAKKAGRIANTSTKTWHFNIKKSRDVAWASSSAFIIDAAKIDLPSGKNALAISAYPSESIGADSWSRSTEYTKASIEHYSKKWFEYPYSAAINVASVVRGMEYPGIVFCEFKAKTESLWGVTDHEFGHIWFPMIVGSNERLYGWMDEGFNSFLNTLSTAEFNNGEYNEKRMDLHAMAERITSPTLENVICSPDNMKESHMGVLAYYKPSIALTILREQILGPERFDFAFRSYIENWAYKHPTPDDFFRAIENASGEDLCWFWRGWFLNNWRFDQAISSVEYVNKDAKQGALITIANNEKMVLPIIADVTTKSGKVSRVKLPIEVWQRNVSWTFKVDSIEEIESVVVDPDHVFPDSNSANNIWKAAN